MKNILKGAFLSILLSLTGCSNAPYSVLPENGIQPHFLPGHQCSYANEGGIYSLEFLSPPEVSGDPAAISLFGRNPSFRIHRNPTANGSYSVSLGSLDVPMMQCTSTGNMIDFSLHPSLDQNDIWNQGNAFLEDAPVPGGCEWQPNLFCNAVVGFPLHYAFLSARNFAIGFDDQHHSISLPQTVEGAMILGNSTEGVAEYVGVMVLRRI